MPELLFYRNVVAVDKDRHRHLRIGLIEDYSFTKEANSVPIAAVEFFESAREYPIVFGGKTESGPIPAVLLSLGNGENSYLDKRGRWIGHYIPAFVRRYPFVLANAGDEQLVVCIDEGHAVVGDKHGQALFTSEGEPTPFLDRAIAFMRDFQAETQRTRDFMHRLVELDLLSEVSARAELKDGAAFELGGFSVVNEAKFRQLDKDTVDELFRKGWLSLIDAHLLSLGNLSRLVDRLAEKRKAAA